MSERLLDPSVLAAIGRLDLVARNVVEGFLIGLHKSPYRGFAQEFAAHRPYIAGDEVRRIDWRLYARTDRLYVKEFEDESNAPVRLLLDVSGSLNYAPYKVSKLAYARYLLAALAYLTVRQNDRVGLTCFGEDIRVKLPARSGQRHLHLILAALEKVEAKGATRLKSCVLREAAQWQRRGLIIIVSDLYDEPGEIVDAGARIGRAGHDIVVFHLLDHTEKELEGRGTYEIRDLETGATLVADLARVRRHYIEQVEKMCGFFRTEFARMGASYVELDPSAPLDKALASFLRQRKQK